METRLVEAARAAIVARASRPLYARLADALATELEREGGEGVPSARALAGELGVNRATLTAAYRELARRGLVTLRPGRPGRGGRAILDPVGLDAEPPAGSLDLARYAPDPDLLPAGNVLRWLGLGEGDGEAVAQYGDARGYRPLREWLAARLTGWGVRTEADGVLLTAGAQHALDLLLRAVARPGDTTLVEDPTYPGLPPLLAVHGIHAAGAAVGVGGLDVERAIALAARLRPRLAVVTPTLHNPSGTVLPDADRDRLLAGLADAGVTVVEELFDPALVVDRFVPAPLAARDRRVVAVGSFSKALFPGLRVGWLAGPRELVARVATVKRATDLSGSPFLEATAWSLCRRGELDAQLERLRRAAGERREIVVAALAGSPAGVAWSTPRGAFSVMIALPPGWSAREVAIRAGGRGVWVLPGPAMSVSARDDVVRLAYAAAGGAILRRGVETFVGVLRPRGSAAPMV